MNFENIVKIFKSALVCTLAGALMYVACNYLFPEEVPVTTTTSTTDTASTVVTHTTIVAKPDGSSVTTVDSSAVANTHAAATTTTPVVVARKKSTGSIGVRAVYGGNNDPRLFRRNFIPKAYDIDMGLRLWQSDAWVVSGYRYEAGNVTEVSVGVRVEL